MEEKDFFYCYSVRLKDFLKCMGFKYINKALHPQSHRPFFMFPKSVELDIALKKWNEIKTLEKIGDGLCPK